MSRLETIARLRESRPLVLPSLLLCDFGNLQREVAHLEEAGVRALHLDVMDGRFVPNFTYGMPIVAAFRKLTRLPLDVHLMMAEPAAYIPHFVEAGADAITFHIEAVEDARPVLETIRSLDVAAGIAFNPGTPLSALSDVLEICDTALVMSVDAGFGGQTFNPVALEKLQQLKKDYPHLLLEVDGGINRETISSCASAGAQMFVVGSAIFRSPSYDDVIADLVQRATL